MFEVTADERCPPSLLGGKYRLEREVGRGGMGVVYLATHTALEQRVAIKVVLPALAENPIVIQRVLREARCAAQITGDHVVRVIDVGQLDSGQPFIVMEYVEGEDLARVLGQRERLPREVAVHWLLEACVALAEAHQKGIVHRDLKPGNLFLARTADGRELIKVIDFGISKQLGSGERPVTRANDVMGSPNYMAPEQIRTPLSVDARADLWAVGAILLELVTGKRAFPGDTITAVYTRVLEGEPDLPEPSCAELPADLRAIVLRCLRKEPSDRFQSVHELVAALSPFAPARSASALHAISRQQRGFAESTRSSANATTRSLGGASGSALPSARRSAATSARRPRGVVVTGVIAGLMLSAAGAALLVDAEARLDDGLETPASPAARTASDAASDAAASGLGSATLATPPAPTPPLTTPPAPTAPAPTTPLVTIAVLDAGQPDGPELAASERELAAPVRSARDGNAAASPLPSESHRDSRLDNAATGARSESAAQAPAALPPEASSPAASRPSPPARNPWDVSTFGGRS